MDNPMWAQRMFADLLLGGLNGVNDAYQNFLNGDVDFGGPAITGDVMADQRVRLAQLTTYVERTNAILVPEVVTRAFGADGYTGDEKAVRLFANSLSGTFVSILQWGREVRACTCDEAHQPLYDALANYVRQPLQAFWDFAKDFAQRAETINNDILAQRTPSTTLALTLKITVAEADANAYTQLLHAPAVQKRRGLFGR